MNTGPNINVTSPFLPSIEEYSFHIQRAFNNNWLTNRGELVLELESKVENYLNSNVRPIIMNNGTIPIQIALKLLGNGGEVITTPFSYVATTSSIVWEGCVPVFVDIEPVHWTIDVSKIEAAITEKTTCILATHVFGNPCEVEEIDRIAKMHNLFVIYDAAHCFGVNYKGKSIFDWGDISTCSFHATKIFHTAEGGAAFVNNISLNEKVYYSHNFGHEGPEKFFGVGINGKISELNSAMGLSVLPYMNDIIRKRGELVQKYLIRIKGLNLQTIELREGTEWNFAYLPILLEDESELRDCVKVLNEKKIFPRRYFYPSLNELQYVVSNKMPIAEGISKRILCLPLYYNLTFEEIDLICGLIHGVLQRN